jgi:hypothetical protein
MDWECGDHDATVNAGERSCKWLIPPSELREKYTDPTLMSTMVWLNLSSSAEGGSNVGVAGFGIIVVSAFDDIEPAGTACPGPVTDCSADWVYLNYVPLTLGKIGFSTMNTELDRRSQAKRRLGNDKGILLVFESFAGGQTFNGHAHVRCLIKE